MEDPAFPDSHYTSTTTSSATTTTVQSQAITIDINYVKSIPGILRIVQIGVGFIYWVMCASCNYSLEFPISAAIICWIFTIFLFLIFLLGLDKRVTFLNWLLTELLNNIIWALIHFISACIVAHRASQRAGIRKHGCISFAAVLGFALMILYGVSAFFNFRIFQAGGGLSRLTSGGGGAAGTTTVTTTTVATAEYPEKSGEAPPPYTAP